MEIGIGLPNAVRGASGDDLVEFARRADSAGFTTLATIGRIAYPTYEELVVLGAAAAVTERIRLMTTILLGPVRMTSVLAKQAVTIDNLSGGRFVLGIAPGGRKDDYDIPGVDFASRGKLFDEQLEELEKLWAGEERGDGYSVVPEPVRKGGPSVILGGSVSASFRRAARYGDGWIMGGGTPDQFKEALPKLEEAWSDAGRDGSPRKLALAYFALGPNGKEAAQESLGDYYAWLGDYTKNVVESAATDADTVKQYVSAFEDAGCDELILFSASRDPEQVDLLREATA